MDVYFYQNNYYVVPSSGSYTHTLVYDTHNVVVGVIRYGGNNPTIKYGEKTDAPLYLKRRMIFIIFDHEINTLAFKAIQRIVG